MYVLFEFILSFFFLKVSLLHRFLILQTKYLSEEVDIVNPPFLVDPAPPFAICYEGPAVPLGYKYNNVLALVRIVGRLGL